MMKPANRAAWGMAVILTSALLVGTGRLLVRLRPYLVARYHGKGASLEGASLAEARLSGADLRNASLWDADLRGADLRCARLCGAFSTGARLSGATLAGADLRGATLCDAEAVRVSVKLKSLLPPKIDLVFSGSHRVKGAELAGADLRGARYDKNTNWPEGFDPEERGVIPTK